MFTIKYHGSEFEQTKTFESVSAFLAAQLMEIPAIQDHLIVDVLEIDGKPVDFKGSIGDLFNQYNQ